MIETLDLGRRFGCVLLATHFVNDPDRERRQSILRVCARHVDPDDDVLIEAYPPTFEWRVGRKTIAGDVTIRLEEATVEGTFVRATVEYEVRDNRWRQPFEAELLDEDDLRRELDAAQLVFDRWLDRERGWLAACAS